MKNFFLDITGRCHSFSDDKKSLNFILNDALLEKFYEIFSDIEHKLGIEINDLTLTNSHGSSPKTKVYKDRTCFRCNNDETENICPRQNTNFTCRILVKIESVSFNNKNSIIYYRQVFLEECRYLPRTNRRLCIDNINLPNNDAEIEGESEEEFNKNIVQ